MLSLDSWLRHDIMTSRQDSQPLQHPCRGYLRRGEALPLRRRKCRWQQRPEVDDLRKTFGVAAIHRLPKLHFTMQESI